MKLSSLALLLLLCRCGPRQAEFAGASGDASIDASGDAGYAWTCLDLPWPRVHEVVVAQVDGQIWFYAAIPIEPWRVDIVAARWSEDHGFLDLSTVVQLRTMYVPYRLSWNGALLIDYSEWGSDTSTLLVYHPQWAHSTKVLQAAYSRRPSVVVGAFSGSEAWVLRNTPYLDNSRINCNSFTPELFRATPDAATGPMCPFESPSVDVGAGAGEGNANAQIELHPTQRAFTRFGCDFGLFDADGGLTQCIDAGIPAREWRRFWPSDNGALTVVSTIREEVPERQNRIKITGLKLWTTDGGAVSESWLADESVYGFRDLRLVDAGVLVLSTRAPRSDDGIVWAPRTFPTTQAIYLFSLDGKKLIRTLDVTMPGATLKSAAEDEKGVLIFGYRIPKGGGESTCYFRL